MTRIKTPWNGPAYEPRDRNLRHQLDALAHATHVHILDKRQYDVGEQRDLQIQTPRGALVATETILGVAYLISLRPVGRAAAQYALIQCRTWGKPSTIYHDQTPEGDDLTLEWRAALPFTAADVARGGLRTAEGMHAKGLTLADLERLAQAP